MTRVIYTIHDIFIDQDKIQEYRKISTIKAVQIDIEVIIHTREGVLKAYPGDYIAQGIEGEIYPIGKEIFEKSYVLFRGKEDGEKVE